MTKMPSTHQGWLEKVLNTPLWPLRKGDPVYIFERRHCASSFPPRRSSPCSPVESLVAAVAAHFIHLCSMFFSFLPLPRTGCRWGVLSLSQLFVSTPLGRARAYPVVPSCSIFFFTSSLVCLAIFHLYFLLQVVAASVCKRVVGTHRSSSLASSCIPFHGIHFSLHLFQLRQFISYFYYFI